MIGPERFAALEFAVARASEPRAVMLWTQPFQGALYVTGQEVRGLVARHFVAKGVARWA